MTVLPRLLYRTSIRRERTSNSVKPPGPHSFLLQRPRSFLMQRQCIRARKNKARDEARDKAQALALATWSDTVRAIVTVTAFMAPNSIDPRSAYTQAEIALVSCGGNVAAALRGLPVSVVHSLTVFADGGPTALPIALAPAVVLLSGGSNAHDANDALRATGMSPIAAH